MNVIIQQPQPATMISQARPQAIITKLPVVAGGGGTGTVQSVNDVIPDGGGNIILTPEDIGAAPALGADDNYVTDAEKAALHGHSNKAALDQVLGVNTGDQDLSPYALSEDVTTVLGGKADLVEGKVPAAQLPAYVDDVLEYATFGALPGTGEVGKIYVTLDTNITYRWSGTGYVEISASLALGETASTAYRGDRGKTAYDHSQSTHATQYTDEMAQDAIAAAIAAGTHSGITITYDDAAGKFNLTVAASNKMEVPLYPAAFELVGSADEPLLTAIASATAGNFHWSGLQFNDSANLEAICVVSSRKTRNYTAGNSITIGFRCYGSAITGNARWQVKCTGKGIGELIDAPFNIVTPHVANIAAAGVTQAMVEVNFTFVPSAEELTASDTLWIGIGRLGADGVNDTLIGDLTIFDAWLVEV